MKAGRPPASPRQGVREFAEKELQVSTGISSKWAGYEQSLSDQLQSETRKNTRLHTLVGQASCSLQVTANTVDSMKAEHARLFAKTEAVGGLDLIQTNSGEALINVLTDTERHTRSAREETVRKNAELRESERRLLELEENPVKDVRYAITPADLREEVVRLRGLQEVTAKRVVDAEKKLARLLEEKQRVHQKVPQLTTVPRSQYDQVATVVEFYRSVLAGAVPSGPVLKPSPPPHPSEESAPHRPETPGSNRPSPTHKCPTSSRHQCQPSPTSPTPATPIINTGSRTCMLSGEICDQTTEASLGQKSNAVREKPPSQAPVSAAHFDYLDMTALKLTEPPERRPDLRQTGTAKSCGMVEKPAQAEEVGANDTRVASSPPVSCQPSVASFITVPGYVEGIRAHTVDRDGGKVTEHSVSAFPSIQSSHLPRSLQPPSYHSTSSTVDRRYPHVTGEPGHIFPTTLSTPRNCLGTRSTCPDQLGINASVRKDASNNLSTVAEHGAEERDKVVVLRCANEKTMHQGNQPRDVAVGMVENPRTVVTVGKTGCPSGCETGDTINIYINAPARSHSAPSESFDPAPRSMKTAKLSLLQNQDQPPFPSSSSVRTDGSVAILQSMKTLSSALSDGPLQGQSHSNSHHPSVPHITNSGSLSNMRANIVSGTDIVLQHADQGMERTGANPQSYLQLTDDSSGEIVDAAIENLHSAASHRQETELLEGFVSAVEHGVLEQDRQQHHDRHHQETSRNDQEQHHTQRCQLLENSQQFCQLPSESEEHRSSRCDTCSHGSTNMQPDNQPSFVSSECSSTASAQERIPSLDTNQADVQCAPLVIKFESMSTEEVEKDETILLKAESVRRNGTEDYIAFSAPETDDGAQEQQHSLKKIAQLSVPPESSSGFRASGNTEGPVPTSALSLFDQELDDGGPVLVRSVSSTVDRRYPLAPAFRDETQSMGHPPLQEYNAAEWSPLGFFGPRPGTQQVSDMADQLLNHRTNTAPKAAEASQRPHISTFGGLPPIVTPSDSDLSHTRPKSLSPTHAPAQRAPAERDEGYFRSSVPARRGFRILKPLNGDDPTRGLRSISPVRRPRESQALPIEDQQADPVPDGLGRCESRSPARAFTRVLTSKEIPNVSRIFSSSTGLEASCRALQGAIDADVKLSKHLRSRTSLSSGVCESDRVAFTRND